MNQKGWHSQNANPFDPAVDVHTASFSRLPFTLIRPLQAMANNASSQLRVVLIPSLVRSLTFKIMPAPSLPFGTERTISTVKAPTPYSESKDKKKNQKGE